MLINIISLFSFIIYIIIPSDSLTTVMTTIRHLHHHVLYFVRIIQLGTILYVQFE